MRAKPLLYVPDTRYYATPFLNIYDLCDCIEDAHTLMLTGGTDVDPTYYGEKRGRFSQIPNRQRDARELTLVEYAKSREMPILGICRGAQFLCIVAGGRLAQHINGHGRDHKMMTNEGKEYEISSLHHQMMLPEGTNHDMIAWAENISPFHLDGNDKNIPDVEVEPEIVFFEDYLGLGIQGHPEFLDENHPTLPYLHRLVRERLL